jgi:GAF domain-containing protein
MTDWRWVSDGEAGASLPARLQATLERMAAAQRSSAAKLRWRGYETAARQAERAAARIHLWLTQPTATSRMFALSRQFSAAADTDALLGHAIEGAIELMGADFGNVQTCNGTGSTLRIAASRGLTDEFLEYFEVVDDPSSACGRALQQGSQSVIVDVRRDAAFTPHRAIAAASGFRAVQSTPIIDQAGRTRGVISTHFCRAHCPSSHDLLLLDWYADRLAEGLAPTTEPERLDTPRAVVVARHVAVGDLRERAVERARRL